VANIQQLVASRGGKWLDQFAPDYFDMILFDEGHHNAADSWKKIRHHFPKAKFTSFTATPIRSDGQIVDGTPVYRFPIADAIREGYIKNIASRRLEPTTIEFVYEGEQQRHSLAEVLKLREEEWFSKGVALAPECNRNIADAAIQCMQELRQGTECKHQIIAAACSIDHARRITSLFRERGLTADMLHSKQPIDEQEDVRRRLKRQELDAVVHVQMLGEGADYPTLSVAAIFRPYRHFVPYVQFIGRIMRVIRENSIGHPDNRGFVVSHVGLHIDRWWEDLRAIDSDDQLFFASLANSTREFDDSSSTSDDEGRRRRFLHPMQVLDEHIDYFVQEHFIDINDATIILDDLIHALELRGLGLEMLGIDKEQLTNRLLLQATQVQVHGQLTPAMVQPQRARQEARRRLDERVRSGAKELLKDLGMKPGGRQLARLYPSFNTLLDLPTAIILLNNEVNKLVGIGTGERKQISEQQARVAHDSMDFLIDAVVKAVRDRMAQ
jgi:type I site-specific restriction endonuclease